MKTDVIDPMYRSFFMFGENDELITAELYENGIVCFRGQEYQYPKLTSDFLLGMKYEDAKIIVKKLVPHEFI